MCQYSAVNGEAQDWHLMHWANLLNSGAAAVFTRRARMQAAQMMQPAVIERMREIEMEIRVRFM